MVVWSKNRIWTDAGTGGGLWSFNDDLEDGSQVLEQCGVTAIVPLPDGGVVAAIDDGTILRISAEGTILAEGKLDIAARDIDIHAATGALYCLDDASGCEGKILDLETLRKTGSFGGYGTGPTFVLSFSPDGSLVASGGRERPRNVSVFPLSRERTSDMVGRIGHSGDARFVEFMDDGNRLVTAGDDGRIILSRPDETQPLLTLFESKQAIRGLAVSRDGLSVAATDGREIFIALPR